MSFEINYELLIIYSLIIFFVNKTVKRNSTLIIIAISWWMFWNFISTSGIGGYFRINQNTQMIYYLFFFSLWLGTYTEDKISIRPFNRFFGSFNFKNLDVEFSHFFKFLLFIIFPITLQFLIRSVYLLETKYTVGGLRAEVYGLNTGTSELFYNSTIIANFYWLCIYPIYWAGLIIGSARYLVKGKISILLLSIVILIMDSILSQGRFGIHYSLFTIVTIIILKWEKLKQVSNKTKVKYTIASILVVFILIFFLFSIRSASSFGESIVKFLIGYHVVSFNIFDIELNNPSSIIHDNTHGFSFFSGIFTIPILIFNKLFGLSNIPPDNLMGGYLFSNRLVGISSKYGSHYNNGFGSNFFSMYRDGGLTFIVLYGILTGYFMHYFSKGIRRSNIPLVSIFFAIYYIIIYGIFQPFTGGPILPAIAIVIVIFIFSKKIYKS